MMQMTREEALKIAGDKASSVVDFAYWMEELKPHIIPSEPEKEMEDGGPTLPQKTLERFTVNGLERLLQEQVDRGAGSSSHACQLREEIEKRGEKKNPKAVPQLFPEPVEITTTSVTKGDVNRIMECIHRAYTLTREEINKKEMRLTRLAVPPKGQFNLGPWDFHGNEIVHPSLDDLSSWIQNLITIIHNQNNLAERLHRALKRAGLIAPQEIMTLVSVGMIQEGREYRIKGIRGFKKGKMLDRKDPKNQKVLEDK